jgi:hypothetical protein
MKKENVDPVPICRPTLMRVFQLAVPRKINTFFEREVHKSFS